MYFIQVMEFSVYQWYQSQRLHEPQRIRLEEAQEFDPSLKRSEDEEDISKKKKGTEQRSYIK